MKKKVLTITGIIAAALFAVYIIFAIFFHNHYFLNTDINGKDFSGLKPEDVEVYLKNEVKDYSLTIYNNSGEKTTIKGSDIELKYEGNKDAVRILKEQNMFAWPVSIFNKNTIDTTVGVSYNEKALSTILNESDIVTCDQTESRDAYPKFNKDKFEVEPEYIGTAVDKDLYFKTVTESIEDFKDEVDLVKAGCYKIPKYKKDSKEIINLCKDMNEMLGANITYKMKDDVVIDSEVIASWLKYDEDFKVYLDEEEIKAWLTVFGDTYDSKGTKRTITSPTGKTVDVEGGTYGWSINEIEELPLIVEHVKNKDVVEKDPVYYEKAAEKSDTDWGTTYAEIDLSSQHMWYIDDGSVVMESDVVTGTPNSKRATPQGVYSLLEKSRDTVLKGSINPETGQPSYETPVGFWMRVTWSGIGLHDATWQSSFGGNRYTYAGSHGCINMPYDKAKQLFGIMKVGTPIIIHY